MPCMSFISHIRNSFGMLTLNRESIHEISESHNGTAYGFIVLIITGIASATTLDMFLIFRKLMTLLAMLALGLVFYHLIGKRLLENRATGTQYFRYLSNSCIIYWLTFIPVIGVPLQIFAGSWMMIINIMILTKVHQLPPMNAMILGGLLPFAFLSASVILHSI